MRIKIAIITSKYLHAFVRKAFDQMNPDCDILIAEYTDFAHIAEIYKKYEMFVDGFMVSGATAVAAIEHHVGELKKPVVSFHADMISFYHALITLFLERRDLDPKRCVFDFLLPFDGDPSVDYLIHEIDLNSLGMTMNHWTNASSVGDFSRIEQDIVKKAAALWESGKIDMILCSYSSIIPLLEERSIPFYFLYPVQNQLEAQLRDLLAQIQLESFYENLPAAIVIMEKDADELSAPENAAEISGSAENAMAAAKVPAEASTSSAAALKTASEAAGSIETLKAEISLGEAIEQLKREFLMDAILQEEDGRYYIYTNHRTVDTITQNFKVGYFAAELYDDYHFSVSVGYGIGKNITEAKRHAENALRESLSANGIFLIDEKSNLIGPLDRVNRLTIQEDISESICRIAEKCKLSTLTIQKLYSIIKINGSPEMTANELAEYLGVTIRNANRILRNLENGGSAVVAYTKSTATKGRPVKVYRLFSLSISSQATFS